VELLNLKAYSEVVDEIYYKVSHLEPWERGTRKTAGMSKFFTVFFSLFPVILDPLYLC
jgi:hypothetical protein